MNAQKKRLIAILAGSLLLGSTGLAMAFGGGGHGYDRAGCDHGAAPMHALHRLDNVTDEQRDQLRKIYQEQRDAMQQRRDSMRESRRAIREAIDNGATTEELRSLATKQGEQVASMIMARAEMRQKMAAILTAEQVKQLQDYRDEMQERRMRW